MSYHGVVYTEALGPAAYIGRARVVPLRNMGAAISPFNSFLILQGIETLPVRMDRICSNTLAVAQYLKTHPKVSWVKYAGLPEHPEHPLTQKYMNGKASGILTFGVQGVLRAERAFKTRLSSLLGSSILAMQNHWPAIRQALPIDNLAPEEMQKAGVSEDMVRLSIGLEHIDDLIDDLNQALSTV